MAKHMFHFNFCCQAESWKRLIFLATCCFETFRSKFFIYAQYSGGYPRVVFSGIKIVAMTVEIERYRAVVPVTDIGYFLPRSPARKQKLEKHD